MKEIKVKDIIKITNAKMLCGNEEEVLSSFKKDTREILEGDTYVGIKGENLNGSEFFEEAFKNGAKACILDNVGISDEILKKYKDKVILITENTITAMQEIAKYKRSFYNLPVIGITGSVGKTSTKDIIASVMSKKYKTLKTIRKL